MPEIIRTPPPKPAGLKPIGSRIDDPYDFGAMEHDTYMFLPGAVEKTVRTAISSFKSQQKWSKEKKVTHLFSTAPMIQEGIKGIGIWFEIIEVGSSPETQRKKK